MYSMNFDITIGKYRLAALEKVAIKCSVENLADTADITLPGTLFNRALKVEQKIAEGDAVRIRLGYDRILRDEFSGYVSEIATDNDSVRIHCEDELVSVADGGAFDLSEAEKEIKISVVLAK